MTSSSPSQELTTGTGTTVRAASAGAASTQRNEEASNALGTEEFATNRPRVGKRKRDDNTKYFHMLSDKGKAVFEEFQVYIKAPHVVTISSVEQYLRYIARYLYSLEQKTSKENGDSEQLYQRRVVVTWSVCNFCIRKDASSLQNATRSRRTTTKMRSWNG